MVYLALCLTWNMLATCPVTAANLNWISGLENGWMDQNALSAHISAELVQMKDCFTFQSI